MNAELTALCKAAQAGGSVLLNHGLSQLDRETIKDVERRSQAAIVSTLAKHLKHFSDTPILPEERDKASIRLLKVSVPNMRLWRHGDEDALLIDPCDGTILYRYGCPEYAISIAQVAHGKPIRAAILLPASSDTVVADLDEGCYINGHRIELRDCDNPADAMIGLDLCRSVATARSDFHHRINLSLINAFAYVRNVPSVSSGFELLLGRTVAHVTGNAKIWDVAGTACAVDAAGGVVSHVDGSPIDWTTIDIEPVLLACGRQTRDYIRERCKTAVEAQARGCLPRAGQL